MNNYQKNLLKEHQDTVRDLLIGILEDQKDVEDTLEVSKAGAKVKINRVSKSYYRLETEDGSCVLDSAIEKPESLIKMCEENQWDLVNWDDMDEWW